MAIQLVREAVTDVVRRGTTRAIYAKQNDVNSRFLDIRIQEDGKDLKVSSDATAMLNVTRSDNLQNIFYGTVNEDGSVRVPMTSWMLELAGVLTCDVSIVAQGSDMVKLSTMSFSIYVEEASVPDGSITDTEEYSVIVDLLNRTTLATEKAEQAAANAQQLREACEQVTAEARYVVDEGAQIMRDLTQPEGKAAVIRVKNTNGGKDLTIWIGSKEEYKTLPRIEENCLYIFNDEDISEEVILLQQDVKALQEHQASVAEYTTYYSRGFLDNPDCKIMNRRYSSGVRECVFIGATSGLDFTVPTGPFFAPTANAFRSVLTGVVGDKLPDFMNISVMSTYILGEESNWVAGPCVSVMVGGAAEYREDYGVVTPKLFFLSNESAKNVSVYYEITCRWVNYTDEEEE